MNHLIRRICPTCFSGDSLATIERLQGLCDFNGFDADLTPNFGGQTDVDWDSTESIGVQCRSCDWQHVSDDWLKQLRLAVPDPGRVDEMIDAYGGTDSLAEHPYHLAVQAALRWSAGHIDTDTFHTVVENGWTLLNIDEWTDTRDAPLSDVDAGNPRDRDHYLQGGD